MAPPPPPSVNLLRAFRALTTIRPVLPTQTRRSLCYKPSTTHTTARARQRLFYRSLHTSQPIQGYRKSLTSNNRSHTSSSPHIPDHATGKPSPILPSHHLLARRFHAQPPLSSPPETSAPPGGLANASSAPTSPSYDRGPVSEEATQTNFPTMDILSSVPPPTSAIDACLNSGFHLNNGIKITDAGVMIVGGEAFAWKPWGKIGRNLLNARGQWDAGGEAGWGMLEVVWPKPDLLILGVGGKMQVLSPQTRARLNALGIRVDVQDTRNAAAQFNLLATERGVESVATALVPVGWVEGRGV